MTITYPITPLPSIHQDVTDIENTAKELRVELGILEQVLGQLANQILLGLVNAVLNALGLGAFAGPLDTMLANFETAVENHLVTPLQGAANEIQSIIDAIANALGLTGTGHSIPTVQTQLADYVQHLAATGLYDASAGFANLGSSLLKGLDAATGDFVGTVDSAATIAGQAASTVQANAQGALDSIVQAAQNDASLVNQTVATAKAELVSFFSGLTAAFSGGNTSSPPAASAADAVLAAGAIQEHLALIGNGAEEQVELDFSTFSNGAMPAVFTAFTNTGSPMTVTGGLLTLNAANSAQELYYNAASCLSDYHQVSGKWHTFTPGTTAIACELSARYSPSGFGSVIAQYNSGTGYWQINGSDTAGASLWGVRCNDTFTPDAEYTLVCGDASTRNPYIFQLLKNGSPLTITAVPTGDASQIGNSSYVDTTHNSAVGATARDCGVGAITLSGGGTIGLSDFKFQDNAPSTPMAFVSPAEATASSTFTKLATIGDKVAVNIGETGKAMVSIDAYSSSANGYVGVSISGANTIAPSIANAAHGLNAIHASLIFDDLDSGLTVFDLEYCSSSGSVTFSDRRVTVVAL
ncbi:hypothetical protein [Mycobacterium terramassiliense]|uniref:hypothetical protein n=1 Tax=Mycobacterium terramassiliense TaxID=1841859 RepID=UPI00097E1273|nr:hypothetical protein [Mycobacterium terramassiliense]